MGNTEVSLDPCTGSRLKIKLYKNVKDLKNLRQKVITGQLHCCVIKANLIVDPMQVIIAANKAAVAQKQATMVTKTVYSEILFNLSLTKNVTKSLMTFGMDDYTSSILVAVIYKVGDTDYKTVFEEIKGDECHLSELSHTVDYKLVKKAYGITDASNQNLLNTIINKIVTKSF